MDHANFMKNVTDSLVQGRYEFLADHTQCALVSGIIPWVLRI